MKHLLAAIGLAAALFAAGTGGAASAPATVKFDKSAPPGTIVIKTSQRRLYYVIGGGQALRYPVGVGRQGMQWSGTAFIDGKYIKPAWVGSSRVDLQACKLEYSIVSPK